MTPSTQVVLRALLAFPKREVYQFGLAKETNLLDGTVHAILKRLEQRGWLTSRWEKIDPKVEGRPRQLLYRPVGKQLPAMRAALARARAPVFETAPTGRI